MPLKDSCLGLRSFVDLSGWGRLSFVVRRSSLEWGPLQTYRFWKLSVTAPRADCQIILSLSVKENRYGKGTAECLSPNSLPSHHRILARATRGAVPWMGPSQVSRNWTWVWLSRMEGTQGSQNLVRKEMSEHQWLTPLPIQPSLPHGYLEGSEVLMPSKCLLVRKGTEFVEVVNPFTTWSYTFAPPCWGPRKL